MTIKANQAALDEQKHINSKKQNTLDHALPAVDTLTTASTHTDITRGALKPSQVPALQRTIGNQAVSRLIQRQQKKPTISRKPNLNFLQRKTKSTPATEKLDEDKPKAPVSVQQHAQGAQPSEPNVQRKWQETEFAQYEWDSPILTPGHDDQTWHFDEELNKLWYDIPHASSDMGRNSQYAGRDNARSVGGWKKAGMGKLMKEIDPDNLAKNFAWEAEQSQPYGRDSGGGYSDFSMKGGTVHMGMGKTPNKDKTRKFKDRQMHFGSLNAPVPRDFEDGGAHFSYDGSKQQQEDEVQETFWSTYQSKPEELSDLKRVLMDELATVNKNLKKGEMLGINEIEYLKSIPQQDLAGLGAYTSIHYKTMNKELRDGNPGSKDTWNKSATSALNQLPPVVGTVYRGSAGGPDSVKKWGYLNVGGIVSDKAFVSTTIDRRYWQSGSGFGDGTIGFEIESKGGAKDVKMLSAISTEDEKLFAPDTKFRVKGLTKLDQMIDSSNVDTISHVPQIRDNNHDISNKNTAAVVIYLEEIPTAHQKKAYKELGQQHGTVDITRAVAIKDLLKPIWWSWLANYPSITKDDYKFDELQPYTQHFYRGVLSAAKLVATNPELADKVIEALRNSADVAASLSSLNGEPEVATLIQRWQALEVATQQATREVDQQAAAEQAQAAARRTASDAKTTLANAIMNDTNAGALVHAYHALVGTNMNDSTYKAQKRALFANVKAVDSVAFKKFNGTVLKKIWQLQGWN